MGLVMNLFEALDWCRTNNATLYFTTKQVCISSSKGKASGATIEEVVEKVVESYKLRSEDDRVKAKLKEEQRHAVEEAAKNGFSGT